MFYFGRGLFGWSPSILLIHRTNVRAFKPSLHQKKVAVLSARSASYPVLPLQRQSGHRAHRVLSYSLPLSPDKAPTLNAAKLVSYLFLNHKVANGARIHT